jgi:hypothetical protein
MTSQVNWVYIQGHRGHDWCECTTRTHPEISVQCREHSVLVHKLGPLNHTDGVNVLSCCLTWQSEAFVKAAKKLWCCLKNTWILGFSSPGYTNASNAGCLIMQKYMGGQILFIGLRHAAWKVGQWPIVTAHEQQSQCWYRLGWLAYLHRSMALRKQGKFDQTAVQCTFLGFAFHPSHKRYLLCSLTTQCFYVSTKASWHMTKQQTWLMSFGVRTRRLRVKNLCLIAHQ